MAIPSIALIPSGYKASKLYSVLPTNGNADLTVVRNSTANRINKDGLIESMAVNVPLLDHSNGTCPSLLLQPQSTNLITYPLSFGNSYWTKSGASIEGDASTAGAEQVVNGDFATDTDWNKGTGWTISGGKAIGSSTTDACYQVSGLTVGKTYKVVYTILDYVSGDIRIRVGTSSSTLSKGANGTYTEYVVMSGSNQIRIQSLGSAFTGSIDNVSVKEVSGFSAPSVDNPTSAFKLVEDTSTGGHLIERSTSVTSGATVTFSVFIKKGENNFCAINSQASGQGYYFDLVNGVVLGVIGSAPNDYEITPLANDWFKISITATMPSTSSRFFVFNSKDGTSISYTGDGTSGVYIFGAQLEQQSYPTSLMLPVTEGSTTTRLKDEVSKSGLSTLISSTVGTLFLDISFNGFSTTVNGSAWELVNNALTEQIRLHLDSSVGVRFRDALNGYANIGNAIPVSVGVRTKLALRMNNGTLSVFANGLQVGSDYTAPNAFSFDGIKFGGLNYNVFNNQIFKSALTDTQIANL